MERKALCFVLGRLVRSAQKIIRGDPAAVGEAVSLVGTVNESMVRSFSFLDATGKHWSGSTKVRYEGEKISLPLIGRECAVKEIGCPSNYFCYTIPLEPVKQL
ncbi:hypothetical protein NECAME_00366 [Necator americanus]|uniref:Uncharacterized protein n=1 Tax=Necator americanus TaxID=51031 RepID=W2TD97_NECAM|nr:hypothetical protein NECAME_00366 [Necator americanus]ETN78992.1 hypothetical protein NECAME_00366 [Necator americanus]